MEHIDQLVTDYVLSLLSDYERRAVERHAAGCPRCMELLVAARRREAHLAGVFRRTMAPPAGRLPALWPQIALALESPAGRPANRLAIDWRHQWRIALGSLGVALVILLGSLGTGPGLDGWLLSTYTPTRAATPTASLTPALSHPSVVWTAAASGGLESLTVTPAPAVELAPESPAPVPLPSSSTLTHYDH